MPAVLSVVSRRTAAARAALAQAITEAVQPTGDVALMRAEITALYTEARTALDTAAALLAEAKRRVPTGRKAALPLDGPEDSDRQWEYQKAYDADRDAWSRTDTPGKLTAVSAAIDAAQSLWDRYRVVRDEWNRAASELASAAAAAGAPWSAEPTPTGMTVLTDPGGRPCGCAVEGVAYVAAQALPDPQSTAQRNLLHALGLHFEQTWVPPAPRPEPEPAPEPSPFDRPAAGPATADPVALARARGAVVVM